MRTANRLQLEDQTESSVMPWLRRWLTSPGRRATWVLAACGLLVIPVSAVAVQGGASSDDPQAQASAESTAKLMQLMATQHASMHVISLNTQQQSSRTATSQQHISVQSSAGGPGERPLSDATVNINGQTHHLPSGGKLHQTITDAQGTTDVNISVDGSDRAAHASGSTSTSSISVQINSSSSTDK